MNIECFAPVIDNDCKILILGSFPSVKSREIGFYYGNKQNSFWKILAEYFDEMIEDDIDYKKEFLLKHNIAIWDIVKSSSLKGSSDSELKNNILEINDLNLLLKKYPNILAIFCNGKASLDIAQKYFPNIDFDYLPSTSPANVSFSKQVWFEKLGQHLDIKNEN